MPQYDDSFIIDDSANQRRNKRSYRVYKKGCCSSNGTPKVSNLGGQGTYALKNNINNLKNNREFGSNYTLKENVNNVDVIYSKAMNKSFPSLLEKDALFFNDDKYIFSPDSRDIYSKNNNYFSFGNGKSLENLANRNHFVPIKNNHCLSNGKSLQNLNDHIVRNNVSKYHAKSSSGYLARARSRELSGCSSYAVNNAARAEKDGGKILDVTRNKEKVALRLAARILESGVYRQLGKGRCDENNDSGFADDSLGGDADGSPAGAPPSSGHKASFRSANKLARRARSFKEDLLERISAMALRSPGPPPSHSLRDHHYPRGTPERISYILPLLGSHSPLSPKARGQQKVDDPEANPAKDLEVLVRQVQFDLKHFGDVISKKKLEMLPGNGTIVLDTITNIHTAIRPYVSPLGACPSAKLSAALDRLCQALARLIRLCDEGMLGGEGCPALHTSNVENVTKDVQHAVEWNLWLQTKFPMPTMPRFVNRIPVHEQTVHGLRSRHVAAAGEKCAGELASIAFEKMGVNMGQTKTNGTSGETKNMKLQVRPTVTTEGQRNSLPDITLTPRERMILEGSAGGLAVRSSHSTESILDSVSTTAHPEPPPKPPRPVRTLDIAPPLPPKRKPNDNSSLLGLTAIDRVSLQSHSSGSLDSMLNISNDEEIRAIMDRSSTHLDDASDITGSCHCPSSEGYSQPNGNRLSLESSSTVGSSPAGNSQRLSSEVGTLLPSRLTGDNINHNRFSNESGFVSMGNARCSEISYSSFNSTTAQHQQKTSLTFIDATPTPGDIPSSMMADFGIDKTLKLPSPPGKTLGITSMANVVQQSMKHVSSSTNIFEQNSTKMFGTSSKLSQAFSQSSTIKEAEQRIESLKMESSSLQSFTKTQRNVSQTVTIGGNLSNLSSMSNNLSNLLTTQPNMENGSDVVDTTCLVPPALPVKTRKLKMGSQCDSLNESGLCSLNSTMDDQSIEYRDHGSCTLHPVDGFMQRPHTLMDQSMSGNQPPPLPLKKKHIMAYMEMFGNCSHSPQSSTEFLRHSVHAYNAVQHHQQQSSGHFVSSSQLQQLASSTHVSNDVHGVSSFAHNGSVMTMTQNGQAIISLPQNGQAIGLMQNGLLGNSVYNQMTQSHTLHQFSMSSTNSSSQQLSGFSSPLRSPHLAREDSVKSNSSSSTARASSESGQSLANVPAGLPTVPSLSPVGQETPPPALPPKRGKPRLTPTQSPAKPVSPLLPAAPSPSSSPAPVIRDGRDSVSPAPKFQFDPPPPADAMEDALLMNVEEDPWHHSPNKPGKFPVEDSDLEQRTNASSSPCSREADSNNETEGEVDLLLEMDVSNYLVRKRQGEEGPEIRGGHPDGLVVHAIKSTKDFSYQEAFLTTYRTFVSPPNLIEKLNRRHAFLARHGKKTKAREVQALLTRVVGDLTMADLDDEMVQLILDFVYGLVGSGDLAMAKALRVIILDKYKSKQLMQQQQSYPGGYQCSVVISARRDSVLEQKAEAVAEQMTLLDAELFTRIPAPEALLWARDQCEERSPNLTRFTEHFNKMSYWARSRILEQEEAKDREKYVTKFIKVMKHLRKMNNFNSYLALLSALDSAPIRRLEWQKHITDGLKEYCALIDSSSSFRAYRQALAETQPPCIPYIGLVLQDLTFVHIGNTDLLPDGSVNFSKRWQQYHILENMKRFSKAQYTFKKNERIIAMFNGFDDLLNEEAMWQISESIKPRGGKKTTAA